MHRGQTLAVRTLSPASTHFLNSVSLASLPEPNHSLANELKSSSHSLQDFRSRRGHSGRELRLTVSEIERMAEVVPLLFPSRRGGGNVTPEGSMLVSRGHPSLRSSNICNQVRESGHPVASLIDG